MRVIFHRYLTGQTPLGIFHNLDTPCESIKYVTLHLGTWRLECLWKGRKNA